MNKSAAVWVLSAALAAAIGLLSPVAVGIAFSATPTTTSPVTTGPVPTGQSVIHFVSGTEGQFATVSSHPAQHASGTPVLWWAALGAGFTVAAAAAAFVLATRPSAVGSNARRRVATGVRMLMGGAGRAR